MNAIQYRDANEGDAATLAALFSDTFRETFGHLYKPDDLAAFLAEHNAGVWKEQLRDGAFAVRMAEADGAVVGLAKLGPLKLPVEPAGPALELRQIYVTAQMQGSGVAATLMDWLIGEARERGARELYLSVYTDNPRAQRFYARRGFGEVGPYVFMVGSQADQDIIMRLAIGQAGSRSA